MSDTPQAGGPRTGGFNPVERLANDVLNICEEPVHWHDRWKRCATLIAVHVASETAKKDEEIARLQDKLGEFRAFEFLLSARYLRIRELVGTLAIADSENRFEETEAKIAQMKTDLAAKTAALEKAQDIIEELRAEIGRLTSKGTGIEGLDTET